jgi:ABC-type lipoprotein release transport system permease subunit
MIWSIAWRNVWRNKVRSIVMIVAIALGLVAGVFTMAFMQGSVNAKIESTTKSELSHLQIHAPHFSENKEISYFISNSTKLVSEIESLDSVEAASPRLIAEPFITAAHGTGGGKLIGVKPEKEKNVTDISEQVIKGTYLEKTSRMPPILIGEKLAKKLKLKIGSKINVQMVDLEGNLSAKGYRVGGIYRTANTTFDANNLFIRYRDLQQQLGIEKDAAHEIAIRIKSGDEAALIKPSIKKIAGGYIVETWKELSPEMSLLTDSMNQYMYIFIMIILLGLCFGIINTMLMAVLERVKEIGMLMAVGMNRRRIFGMIILESVLLTITGGFIGILTGAAITKYFETTPIDISMFSKGLEKFGFATQVYTSYNTETLVTIAVLVIITGLISAVYPARKALKLNPAEATRSD